MTEYDAFQLYALTAVILFSLGFHSLLSRRDLLRKILGLNVMSAGVFLLFIAVAHRNGKSFADPVPQAMVITGIVVSISATAFALALARRIRRKTGLTSLDFREKPAPESHDRP